MQDFFIGPWHVRPRDGLITGLDQRTRVEPKAMAVLVALTEGRGDTVSRQDLFNKVWPNQDVTDDVLTSAISTLRRYLGDDSRTPQFIETVPKRGYRLVAKVVPPGESAAPTARDAVPASRQRSHAIWPWALVATLIVASASWWLLDSRQASPGREITPGGIAVLPFDVFSENDRLDHFASGLEEELIHRLAAEPGLHVIARTSSARFAEKTHGVSEISQILGVGYVIEGSVRDAPDGMRITVQLIDAENEGHLWSHVFDVGQENLIEVQEQVGAAVRDLVADPDMVKSAPTLRSRHPVPDSAYRLFLLGEAHMRVGTADAYESAGEYYSDAIRIAPAYALAWSRLAATFLLRHQYSGLPLEEAARQAENALERALTLDPGQPEALATLGLKFTYEKDYPAAESYFERALERQPNLRFALHNYGFALWSQAKYDAALVPLRKALQIDPLSGVSNFLVADSLAGAGEFEAALEQYESCRNALPEYHACAAGLSTVYRLFGNYDLARSTLVQAASLVDEDYVWQLLTEGLLAVQLGEYDVAVARLDGAAKEMPGNYALWRARLQVSLATNTLSEFVGQLEQFRHGREGDRDLALISALAAFHGGDCEKAWVRYQPYLGVQEVNLFDVWDMEAGLSHAVALAYCSQRLGLADQNARYMESLETYVSGIPQQPISAQRYLRASYNQLLGNHAAASQELSGLREVGWPLIWIAGKQPIFQ